MSLEFDGEREISQRLERGQSYGLSKDMYGALAHVSMAALRMADVQPAEIRVLEGRPGCDVTLFGHAFQFTIRMEPWKERSTLFGLPLDSKLAGLGVELCMHQFNGSDYVGNVLEVILRHEGVPLMDAREAADYVREQQQANPPRPRRILE
jgi:hypothetical protein